MKTCIPHILLVLCAMAILSGCDPQVYGNTDTETPTQSVSPSVPEGSGDLPSLSGGALSDSAPAGAEDGGETQPWYGEWRIEDYVLGPVGALSEQDARALLGEVVSYGEKTAESQGQSYADPSYSVESVSAEDFCGSYRGQLTFGDIRLDGEEARFVSVSNAAFLGDGFYLRDNDSLVMVKEGAFFLARRTGRTVEETRIVQTLDIQSDGWGKARLIASLPVPHEDVLFLLEREGQIVYTFPAADSSDQGIGVFDSMGGMAFQDVNGDGQPDVVSIVNYVTGAGPQGMVPRPALRIYLQDGLRFVPAFELMGQVMEYVDEAEGGSLTMDAVWAYFGLNGV